MNAKKSTRPAPCFNGAGSSADASEQIERIEHYEDIYFRASGLVAAADAALSGLEAMRHEIDELKAYYSGEDWKKDFCDDEAGKLPEDLKRGVLSEDGFFDLLDDLKRLFDECC